MIVKCIRMIVKRIERDIAREGIILLSLGVYGVISTGKICCRLILRGNNVARKYLKRIVVPTQRK